jgi:hypothetical protein
MNFSETEEWEKIWKKKCSIPTRCRLSYEAGIRAGQIAEHKDVIERAFNFTITIPEIKEKIEKIKEQARQEALKQEHARLEAKAFCITSGIHACEINPENCDLLIPVEALKKKVV